VIAVALAEHARRQSWNADNMNLGQSIGDFVAGYHREDSGHRHPRGNHSRGSQSRGSQSHGHQSGRLSARVGVPSKGAILFPVGGDGGSCGGGDSGKGGGGC
jgi:hypothetical protein